MIGAPLLVLAALSGPLEAELELRLEAPAAVVFGETFTLVVERRWSDGWRPEPWRDDLLEPLVVRDAVVSGHDTGVRRIERRELQCCLFELDELVLPPVLARAHRDGRTVEARSNPLLVLVTPLIDRERPGGAELPGGLLHPAPPQLPWRELGAGVLVFAAGVAAVVVWRRRRHREPPRPTAHSVAAGWLERLRSVDLDDDEARRDVAVEAAALVREFYELAPVIPARAMSTEEVREEARRLPGSGRPAVAVLEQGDRVKYGRHRPEEQEVRRGLEQAASVLEEHRELAGSGPPSATRGPSGPKRRGAR